MTKATKPKRSTLPEDLKSLDVNASDFASGFLLLVFLISRQDLYTGDEKSKTKMACSYSFSFAEYFCFSLFWHCQWLEELKT